MLVLTFVTAVQRFVKVWKQAGVAPVDGDADRDATQPPAEPPRGAHRTASHAHRSLGSHRSARQRQLIAARGRDRQRRCSPANDSARATVWPTRQRSARFRLGSLAARLMPGPVAAAAAASLGFGASFAIAGASGEMFQRHLRRVNPSMGRHRAARGHADGVRQLRPLLHGELPAADAVEAGGRARRSPSRAATT